MGLNLSRIFRISLYLWFPVSVGGVDYLSDYNAAGVSIQYVVVVFAYLTPLIFFIKGKYSIPPILSAWLFFVFVSWAYGGAMEVFLQVFSLSLLVLFASCVVGFVGVERFIIWLVPVCKFWLIASVVYIPLFWSDSFSYVNDVPAISSFYDQKNTYGRFLCVCGLFLLTGSYIFKSRGMRPSFFIEFLWLVLVGFLLFISASKSSIILFVVMLCLYFLVDRLKLSRAVKISMVFFLFFPILIVIARFYFGFAYFDNLGSALDCFYVIPDFCIPGTGRYTIWHAVVYDVVGEDRSVFGFGYGYYFSYLNDLYLSGIGLGEFIPNDSHNGYIEIFASMGWVGIFVLIFFVFYQAAFTVEQGGGRFLFFFIVLFLLVTSNISQSYFLKTTNIYAFLWMLSLGVVYNRKLVQ